MNSIKMKVIALVLSCIAVSSVAIGGASLINSKRVIAADSVQIMNLLCENRAMDIDALLSRIEQSVETLGRYTAERLTDVEAFKQDQNYVKEYLIGMRDMAINAATNTEGALTVYIRFNPQFTDPQSGFFYARQASGQEFVELPPTDLSAYDPEERERVGWFYEPVKNGKGTWMSPYFNKNIDMEIISYVIPIYVQGELIGVVGMDIDFHLLQSIMDQTRVYNTGYSFLTDDQAQIVYHKVLERRTDLLTYNQGEFSKMAEMIKTPQTEGSVLIHYIYYGEPKKAAYRSLINGMRLVLTAPTAEIDRQENQLLTQIVTATVLIMLFVVLIAVLFARRLVRPLQELTEAAKKVAAGDMSVSIRHQSKDEVGALADSFRQTVAHLNQYITYINELAYQDSLTGAHNKTAYLEMAVVKDQQINEGNAQFAVVVFDINGLKAVNDTYGHDFGDILIISASKIMRKVFCRGPVYRIGGDEFVTVLENWDYDQYRELLEMFRGEVDLFNENSPQSESMVSVACGVALYVKGEDQSFNDVFKKADTAMYGDKAKIKGIARNY